MGVARPRPPIVITDGVARIPLTRGLFTIVDEGDLALVGGMAWYAQSCGSAFYAARHVRLPVDTVFLMHRVLLGVDRGSEADHVNHDTLDNRRANLRIATSAQNKMNQRLRRDSSSGFRGVHRHGSGKWVAKASDVYLGIFATREEAARVYDHFVLLHRGEFARLNFPT